MDSSSQSIALLDSDAVLSMIHAMQRTEQSYKPVDYFHRFQEKQSLSSPSSLPTPSVNGSVDVDCRATMCEWCFQIVDHCQFQRESVSIAMNLLDRFLSSDPMGESILRDRGLYQLAAMACLYTTVKIHEPLAISSANMAGLSKGVYTKEQIETMESTVLRTIQWRIHPATPMTFCHYMCELLSPARSLLSTDSTVKEIAGQIGGLDDVTRETLIELSKMQTELAVREFDLCLGEASSIAFAAIMNAIHSMDLPVRVQKQVEFILMLATGIDSQSCRMEDLQVRLYQSIVESPFCVAASPASASALVGNSKSSALCRDTMGSPRSVSITTAAH